MKIGYQLYSAAPLCETAEGLKNTIQKIGQMGYDGVEFFSYCGIPAGEMKQLLAQCGLEACNSHVQLERFDEDAEGEFRYAREVGIPFVTVPWIPPELRNETGYEKIRQLIPRLIALGEKYDVGVLYHNHDFEFEKHGSEYILDSILDINSQCGLELDTFWAWYAGAAPLSYLEEHHDRLAMIHVKDYLSLTGGGMDGTREKPSFCAIGTGKMENTPIFQWAKDRQLPWVIVEQDNSSIDILESARLSIAGLRKAGLQ